MGLGAPAGTEPAAPSATDTNPAADQSQDQGQPPASGAAAPAGQSAAERNLQAAFTQRSQHTAALARFLDIPRDASAEEFIAAIESRTAAPAADDEHETPEMARRRRELDQHAWEIAEERYGPEMAQRTKEFLNAKANRDPIRAVASFNAAVLEMAQALNAQGANSPAGEQAPPGGQQQRGQGGDFPELGQPQGGSPPSNTMPNPDDFKGNPDGFAAALMGRFRRS